MSKEKYYEEADILRFEKERQAILKEIEKGEYLDEVFITSLEIAKVFNKRHDSVLRIINKLKENLDIFNELKIKETLYKDKSGKRNKMYLLNKEATLFIIKRFRLTNNLENINKVSDFLHSIGIEDNIILIKKREESTFIKKLELFCQAMELEYKTQKQIGDYFVDFYIEDLNLIIEYDEYHHQYTKNKDKQRDQYFQEQLYDVLHIKATNNIDKDFIEAIKHIIEIIEDANKQHSYLSGEITQEEYDKIYDETIGKVFNIVDWYTMDEIERGVHLKEGEKMIK